VTGFGLRCNPGTTDRAAFTATVEIRVSSTAAVPGALSSTWVNNVGNDQVVVLAQQVVNIPAMPANRGAGTFATFTFDTPFIFGLNGNPNICVDFLVFGRSAGASWSTDRGFASTAGRAATVGIGCATGTVGSTSTAGVSGNYTDGSTITFTIANGQPNALALLLPSANLEEFVPGFPLPLPLSLFGGPVGCDLLVNTGYGSYATVTSPTGAASIPLTISGFGQFCMGAQWLYVVPQTPQNTLGIEALANRAVRIGPDVCVPNAQYVYDLFSATDATGTATTNAIPVVQFHLL
jgi:hypothetical protein